MADAGAGRHHGEIRERLLAPFEEAVTLLILLVFALDVLAQRLGRAGVIDHHRMVDHQIDGDERVDLGGIAAQRDHRVAHGGEIHHRGNAGEVLHQHARGAEGDLVIRLALMLQPADDRLDVLFGDAAPVLVAQQILQHDLHRERQVCEAPASPFFSAAFEGIILVRLGPDGEGLAAFETVKAGQGGLRRGQGNQSRLLIDNSRHASYTARGRRTHGFCAFAQGTMRLSAQNLSLERGGRLLLSQRVVRAGGGRGAGR